MCKSTVFCGHNECRAWMKFDLKKIQNIYTKVYNKTFGAIMNKTKNELISDFCKDDVFLTNVGVIYAKNGKLVRIKVVRIKVI